jgi:hypothetical protein
MTEATPKQFIVILGESGVVGLHKSPASILILALIFSILIHFEIVA